MALARPIDPLEMRPWFPTYERGEAAVEFHLAPRGPEVQIANPWWCAFDSGPVRSSRMYPRWDGGRGRYGARAEICGRIGRASARHSPGFRHSERGGAASTLDHDSQGACAAIGTRKPA